MYNRAQYVNRFYEKNLTTTVVTISYYLGGTLVAQRENTTLRYTHQDHLTGTSLMTDTNGNSLGTMKYYPYGSARSGSVPTDELFTGQKLDGTGLYYYGARYYDPVIGRFISPDPITHSKPLPKGRIISGLTVYVTSTSYYTRQTRSPRYINPQEHNRYSYALNNPLKYIDPDGHQTAYLEGLAQWFEYIGSITQALPPQLKVVVTGGMIVVGVVYTAAAIPDIFVVLGDNINIMATVVCTGWTSWWSEANPERSAENLVHGDNAKIYETPEGYTPPDYSDDPAESPGEEWEWKPKETTPDSRKGNWYNPKTGESIHRDLPHGKYGPHNDWRDPSGDWWRVAPDGSITPK